jgi:hypothetical protein
MTHEEIIAIGMVILATGGLGYVVYDIKQFKGKLDEHLKTYKIDVNSRLTEFHQRLNQEAQDRCQALHNPSGSLIYVTDEDCRRRMASCPAGAAVQSLGVLEARLSDQTERWTQTRECFLKEITEIKTILDIMCRRRSGDGSEH